MTLSLSLSGAGRKKKRRNKWITYPVENSFRKINKVNSGCQPQIIHLWRPGGVKCWGGAGGQEKWEEGRGEEAWFADVSFLEICWNKQVFVWVFVFLTSSHQENSFVQPVVYCRLQLLQASRGQCFSKRPSRNVRFWSKSQESFGRSEAIFHQKPCLLYSGISSKTSEIKIQPKIPLKTVRLRIYSHLILVWVVRSVE